MPARPPPPAALLGEEVQSVTNRVIFITAVSGWGRRVARGWGQRSSHSSSLSKLGLAQPEAGSLELELELEPEPGLPASRDPGPHRLPHLLPAALPS